MSAFPLRRLIATTAAVLTAGTVVAAGAASAAPQPLRERELASSAGWTWFTDPRSVHHQGLHNRTYTGWVAQDGSIQISSYDHDTGRRVVVTLKARLQIDDHDNPSILVRPDGRLMVFWSTHAGPTMWYRRSLHPEDITSWEPERVFPTNTSGTFGYTYSNPMQLSAEGNRIYLFWRGGNFNPAMSTSLDGNSWTPARTVIYNPGQRPYVKYASNGRDTIAMAFTESHPRATRTSIYYAAYRAGALRRADGSVIKSVSTLPIAPTSGQKVYDQATSGKAWVHDVALDAAGRPVIVYAVFPTDTDHRYRYARWDGTRWVDRELVRAGRSMSVDPSEPNYSGGISLDHDDPSIVYLSREVNGVFEVEAWSTPDGGASWTSRPLTAPSAQNNYRPISPRGQTTDDMDIVWMHGTYPSYQNFKTGLRTQIHTRDIVTPAAVAWAPRRLDVFARDGQSSALLQKYFSSGWSGWISFGVGPGGHPVGPPTVASWAPGRLDVFAVDQVTGQLLQRTYDGRWHGWVSRGYGPSGHRVTAPAAVSWSSGRIDVLARDEVTDDLIHFWQSGTTWFGPQRLAAGPGGDYVPSVASWDTRRLDVFAVDSTESLTQFWFDGSRWHGWLRRGRGPGGVALIQPAAVAAWGPGRLDVFALVIGERSIAHWWYDAGAWRGLQALGTGPDPLALTGLAATSWGPGRLDVFAVDQQRHDLTQLFFDGRWNGPMRLDFDTMAPVVTTTLSVDAAPRSTPIPVSPEAAASD